MYIQDEFASLDRNSPNRMEEAQVVPPFHLLHPHVKPKGTTLPSLQSIADDNGTPATWTLVLSSSKPLTGRTGQELRDASATGTTGDAPLTGHSHNRTRTHRSYDDMPCRTPLH